jgi:hypothetical protein
LARELQDAQRSGEVTIPEIAERLQQDLIESHLEKLKKLRNGTQLKFVQSALGDWGYMLTSKRIHDLAAKAKSYDVFIWTATK